jgi:thiol-disulfide isomerase/thioredoxin
MRIVQKYLTLAVVLIVFGFLNSCSNENYDQKIKDGKVASSGDAKVYPLVSNSKANGKIAADFVWEENGKQVRYSEYSKGKFVLLNFWGTWCPPCRREIPDLVAIANEMENKGLLVLGVALERTESMSDAISKVSGFWNDKQMYYPVIIGTGALTEAYGGIESIPTTFLINDKGEIFQTIIGGRSKGDFMSEINNMMNKTAKI